MVPLSFEMMPAMLKLGGYKTHMLGKWHHDFVESAEGDAYRALLASEARRREGLEVAFFKRRKALMLQDARAVQW